MRCDAFELFDSPHVKRMIWIPYDGRAGEPGLHFLEQLQPFGIEVNRGHHRETGDVTPGFAKLLTSPEPTGSSTRAMTLGIVDVARFAAAVPTVLS